MSWKIREHRTCWPNGRSLPRLIAVEEFVQEGECLVYNPSRDEASALNRTTTEVWSLCDGRLTVSSGMAGVPGERYGMDDAILLEFLSGSPQS